MALDSTSTTPASGADAGDDVAPGLAVAPLDAADLAAARAAAAARNATVRRAAEAHARALRDEARERIRSRRDAGSGSAAAGAAAAGAGARQSGTETAPLGRTVTLPLGRLVLGALAMALVAGLVGGLAVWGLTGARGGGAVLGSGMPIGTGGTGVGGPVGEAAAVAAPSVVALRVTTATRHEVGSGVVLSDDGLVLTNAHVVTLDGTVPDASIEGTTADGRVFSGTLVGLDPLADLAVVRLDGATGLVPATWGDSSTVDVGQPTVVLGSPLGLTGTVTSGVVSTAHRSIEIASAAVPDTIDANVDPTTAPGLTPQPVPPGGSTIHLAVFQTDAPINPGNSGGPVVDLDGRVIGIAVAIATTSGGSGTAGSIGIGFAIPGNAARRVADDLVAGRTPSHGALGASVMSSTNVDAVSPRIAGAFVDAVAPDGAAARAGLERGDVVTSVEGLTVAGPSDLLAFVRLFPAGTVVTLTVVRDGDAREVDVTLDRAG